MTPAQIAQELRDGLHNVRLSSPGYELATLTAAVDRVIVACAKLEREAVAGDGEICYSRIAPLRTRDVMPDEIDEDPEAGWEIFESARLDVVPGAY